jgi:tetratricopeptide (TPR) repeat protein
LENAPNNVYVWTWKGIILSNLGRFEEAIKCYDKALEIYPNYALAQANKNILNDKLIKEEKKR